MNNTPGNAQRQGAEPRRASTLNAISNPKPHFHCKHSNFWYAFGIYKPKEPSLWFVRVRLVSSLVPNKKEHLKPCPLPIMENINLLSFPVLLVQRY